MDQQEVSLNHWKWLLTPYKDTELEEAKEYERERRYCNFNNKGKSETRIFLTDKLYLREKEAKIFKLLLTGVERCDLLNHLLSQQRTIDSYIQNAMERFEVKKCKHLLQQLKDLDFLKIYEGKKCK